MQRDLNNKVALDSDYYLSRAMKEVKNGNMSIYQASKTFNIPYTKLYQALRSQNIKSAYKKDEYRENISDEQLKIIISEHKNTKQKTLYEYLKQRNISTYALIKKLISAYSERDDMVKRQQRLLQAQKIELEVQAETIKDLRDKVDSLMKKQKRKTNDDSDCKRENIILKGRIKALEQENQELKRQLEGLRKYLK